MDPPATPNRAAKLRDLFDKAVGMNPDDRTHFLDDACQDDSELRNEVESLLDADVQADDVLHDLDRPFDAEEDAYIGRTISHYDIVAKLGRGGMGVVYKALDTRLRRPVALKFLPPHLSGHSEAKRRLIREARAASRLDHPSICNVHDIDEVDGQMFIVMEFVDGPSLADKIAQTHFEPGEAIQIIMDVAQGLAAAHESGIIHRDIKPANVMLTQKGKVKIMDFGLAKLITDTTLTQSGVAFGTASYMSPEQARGDRVDKRSDLFSLGVVLYEMISSQRAFKGDFPEAIVYSILNEEPETLSALRPTVPKGLNDIVMKCLSKDVSSRYQSAASLLDDLRFVADPAHSPGSKTFWDSRSSGATGDEFQGSSAAALPKNSRSTRFSQYTPAAVVIIAMTIALVAGIRLGRIGANHQSPRQHYAELTVKASGFLNPSISPNGRYVAYRGNGVRGDEHILFIYDFETGITHEHRRDRRVRIPVFSPDNASIGFLEGAYLYIAPVDFSTPPVRTFEMGNQYVWWLWAPNRTVMFIRGDLKKLERIRSDGTIMNDVAIADPARDERSIWPLNFFSDGRLLIGIEDSTTSIALYALDIESGLRQPLPNNARTEYAVFAQSGHILSWPKEISKVYSRAIDLNTLEYVSDPVETLSIRNVSFALSEAGRLINYSDPRDHGYTPREISLVDMSGTKRVLTFPVENYRMIRVDPTSQSFAYSLGKDIYVAALSGESVSRRVIDAKPSHSPVWVAQGEELLYDQWGTGTFHVQFGREEFPKLAVSKKHLISLVKSPPEFAQHIAMRDASSDGSRIAVVERPFDRVGRSITVVSIADSSIVLQIRHQDGVDSPRFSPDGTMLAYVRHSVPNPEIRIARLDGQYDISLVRDGIKPTWSSDQRALYFLRNSTIHELPIQVGEPVYPTGAEREIYQSKYHFYYDVMPDGSGFVVSEATELPTRTITVIDNFFEILNKQAVESE